MFRSALLAVAFFLASSNIAIANDNFITVVNPVRVSANTPSPVESLKAQYNVVQSKDIPATWLVTYDVLKNDEMIEVLKLFDEQQEIGIFLEVGKELAENSSVSYNDLGGWHYASSIFLSGYSQDDRKRLIDTVFERYKSIFGYYPKSVGSWWTDSYSQEYMANKYGVIANLGCADQFSTDGYRLWGQFWSTPYYPSKYHTGIPAGSEETKLTVVNMQWASRDPIEGYYSSLYSLQDYHIATVGKDITYFNKLLDVYLFRPADQFGHVVIGLEGDLPREVYSHDYEQQLAVAANYARQNKAKIMPMGEFAAWYINKYPYQTPASVIRTADLNGANKEVVWYQSVKYRIGVLIDHNGGTLEVLDLRIFQDDFKEPYYLSPNRERKLYINTPSITDSVGKPWTKKVINSGKVLFTNIHPNATELNFEQGSIALMPEEIKINGFNGEGENISLTSNSSIRDYYFNSTSVETDYLVRTSKFKFAVFSILIVLMVAVYKSKLKAGLLVLLAIVIVIGGNIFISRFGVRYEVPQEEVAALVILRSLNQGKVLVYDDVCLQCEWYTSAKPAVFANKRGYVSKLTNKPIVQAQSVFNSNDRGQAKAALVKSRADYIYLVKHGAYREQLPFSPGDLGVEMLYENANAEIWEVKN